MDVQHGHCWRCEKQLPKCSVQCPECPLAKYCTRSCLDRDTARHKSVECQVFGKKKCSECGKTGVVKECSQCNIVWYCNKDCQLRNWENHKRLCLHIKADIKSLSANFREGNISFSKIKMVLDPPYYIGNIVAKDFLRLDNNEWSGKVLTKEDMARDYHVLSAGCGDLRNTVLTAGSLPDRYQGKIHVTLNDFDPFVMARNVLFLFMLVRFADTEGIESCLTTIWYSVHITKKEYDLIKTSLDELIQMDAESLHVATKGVISGFNADLKNLSQVWEMWKSLECQKSKSKSINLSQQRKVLLDREKEGVSLYLRRLSTDDQRSMFEWFDHGNFVPSERSKANLPFDNPTMTGRGGLGSIPSFSQANYASSPKVYKFVYCIKACTFPFVAWDCLRVREYTHRPCTSPMVMYHNYVTNLLQRVKRLTLQGRFFIHTFLTNCLKFPNCHRSLQMAHYDRIFTSNLSDYVGTAKLLQIFKPLLNRTNSKSALVTETINWVDLVPGADHSMVPGAVTQCMLANFADTQKFKRDFGYNDSREYFNNIPHFLVYLRAEIMGGGLGIPSLKNVPSLSAVMNYNGMQMRDFRKEVNRLVPFQYRVTARDLSMMNGYDRAVEWYLPQEGAPTKV
ncbi:uncharacterized protein [Asterias amurensis]|uniref:uncharacterized protein n=1 Tax=Asterias amurensis TaxID=7602 RepID=UPI003AB69DA8